MLTSEEVSLITDALITDIVEDDAGRFACVSASAESKDKTQYETNLLHLRKVQKSL